MLSFMREQRAGNSSERPQAGASLGAADPQEFLTVAANSKNLRRSTILVAVLVTIGLACLGLMIHRSQPQAAAAKQAGNDAKEIEAAIARLTGVNSEVNDGKDAVVRKFSEVSNVLQVKVSELAKDPFQSGDAIIDEPRQEVLVGIDPDVLRHRQFQQQANALKLLSVMRSQNGGHCCMINDQILRQGDTIENFTVKQISGNSVELVWLPGGLATDASKPEDFKILLKLSE